MSGKVNLWNKAKCFLGFHNFSDWKYKTARSCIQERFCSRCGTKEEREIHQWGNWYYKYQDSCQQERTCTRCTAKENREAEHIYGDWVYVIQGSCELRRICARCGAYLYKIEHQWGDWEFKSPNTCEQIKTCRRCGIYQQRSVPHSWSEWKYESPSSCGLIRHCIRCFASETRPPEHQWTPWERIDDVEIARVCRHCGKTETRYEPLTSPTGTYSLPSNENDPLLNAFRRLNEVHRINSESMNRTIENMSKWAEIIKRLQDDD